MRMARERLNFSRLLISCLQDTFILECVSKCREMQYRADLTAFIQTIALRRLFLQALRGQACASLL